MIAGQEYAEPSGSAVKGGKKETEAEERVERLLRVNNELNERVSTQLQTKFNFILGGSWGWRMV